MEKNWLRRTILFLSGQIISMFGSSLVQFGISWYITLLTENGVIIMVATLCGFLPQVLISLFAGVWADRYNRKVLIILADSMIAICTAVLAVLFSVGYESLWLLFVISAIRSIGAGIQSPAVSALLPELVPPDKLMRVNGINDSIMGISMLVAPAIAGGLYGALGIGPIFWVDVATAVIGISLLMFLKYVPEEKKTALSEHFIRDMFSGIRYVMDTPWLYQLMGFYLFYALMFGPVVFLTPLMVAVRFGKEPWRLMLHEIVFSGGSIIGGLLIGVWGGFKNRSLTLLLACSAFGLTTLIMGFSPDYWFYLGAMLPMGITMPFINTSSMTIMQTNVKPELMGRTFGLSSIVFSGAMPLSMVVFGPLEKVTGVGFQLIVTGALMIGSSLLMLKSKSLMRVGKPLLEMES